LGKESRKNKVESELSQEQVRQLREFKIRDREVRAHEQAHASAAGSLAKGSPNYSYQRGPDGQVYAVGGEVQIDTSAIAGDAEATAEKARQIQRAALAPAQPSQQDRAIAAAALAMESQARVEIAQQISEDNIEKLNTRFSDETSNIKGEQNTETNATGNSEINSKCAECGGQHSSESHTVTVTLGETFNQTGMQQQKENQFNIAI